MPFNNAMMLGGRRTFILTDTGGTGVYNVENQVSSVYGLNTTGGDLILLEVTGDRNASSVTGLAIDATGLHASAVLIITLTSADVNSVGGKGGNGGSANWSFEGEIGEWAGNNTPGAPGQTGGDAISLGCNTTTKGTGTIRSGKGGGGGGGAFGTSSGPPFDGGSGAGGGAPNGVKGNKGTGNTNNGNDGTAATETVKGDGGAAVGSAGAGGDGGHDGLAASAGETKSSAGGIAGTDGSTVVKNGKTLTKLGSVTYEGNEAA